jgi:6-phosphogluconolactonase
MMAARRDFADRQILASALARDVAQRLDAALRDSGGALIAVSGGTTPKVFLERLSREPIDWSRVTVTLVDERCVPEESERSNARLVKTHLLANAAVAAAFVPLFKNESAAANLGRFDVVVLGMGTDGHTASFFPRGDRLADALDVNRKGRIIAIEAPGAGEPRLTFSLPALLDAGFIALHIEGKEKAQALVEALEPGPVEDMPVRAVLRAAAPIIVYWSP